MGWHSGGLKAVKHACSCVHAQERNEGRGRYDVSPMVALRYVESWDDTDLGCPLGGGVLGL